MNYFGHAALAVLKGAPTAFVLGAMVPDLLQMTGKATVERRRPEDPLSDLQAGIEFHFETDRLFHDTKTFLELNQRALSQFRQAGISRGPTRAGAHLGVEMLFDSELVRSQEYSEGYLASLEYGVSSHELGELYGSAGETARLLCAHLLERGVNVHTRDPERLSYRILRTLEGRPRLSPTKSEARLMANLLDSFEDLTQKTHALLSELRPLYLPSDTQD